MHITKKHGFTLIEVVVALAIFAVLSITGYKGIDALLKTKERVETEDQKWQQLMLFFDRFELDVKQSVNRPVRTADDQIEPAWIGRPTFAGNDGAQLSISRFGDADQVGYLMDSRRIGYRLNKGAVELLVWPALDVASASRPEVFVTMPNVSALVLRYLNGDGQWLASWPVAGVAPKPALYAPSAVSLSITLKSGETMTRIFSL